MFSSIPRPHTFVHHFNSTSPKLSKMIICSCSTSTTSPAEFIFADSTSHMITSFVLLYFCTTHGTERDVIFILSCPSFYLFFKCLITSDIVSMPSISALKAYLGLALRAFKHRSIFVLSLHVRVAVWFDAPSD